MMKRRNGACLWNALFQTQANSFIELYEFKLDLTLLRHKAKLNLTGCFVPEAGVAYNHSI
ncbi:hypothetical protein WN53_03315 [Serratia fonticola]|nr:hypothetical protein WN53_03315 [Serratia fonticola]